MEIIGCGKGHYYNPELYSSCPECAKEKGNAGAPGVTEPVHFDRFPDGNDIGVTAPVDFNPNINKDSWNPPTDGIGVTEPVGNVNSPILETDFFREPTQKTSPIGHVIADFGPTAFVDPIPTKTGVPFQPVVGWLVCIDGPAKGRDYRIHSQYNYIGRGQHMDICISGDNCISTDRAAVLAYDSEEKFFSFGPSMGHNVVRVNGKMLMNAVVLNAYDELTIGKTKLLFVPLCGERFDWNDK